MSSNRWRRFAFFDKSNIVLSKDIINELQLIPDNNKNNKVLTKKINDSCTDTDDNNTLTNNQDNNNNNSFTISCCSYQTLLQNKNNEILENENNNNENALLSSSSSSLKSKNNISLPKSVVNVSALVQSTCGFPTTYTNQTLSSIQSSTTMTMDNNNMNNDINTNANHPFVFIFISSKNTYKVFCLDVSLQCNNITNDINDDNDGIVDDNDDDYNNKTKNYIGYFIPFPNTTATTTTSSSSLEDRIIKEHLYSEQKMNNLEDNEPKKGGRIVGLTSIGNSNDDLYVGVISDDNDTGVIVYKNPHNYLITNNSNITNNNNIICYKPIKPLGSTNTNEHNNIGKACTITMLSSASGGVTNLKSGLSTSAAGGNMIVAVGTDTGYVIVYTFNPTTTNNNKLVLWMEIPPPPSNQNQNIYVTNVLLSNTNNDDKILLYVTYSKNNNNDDYYGISTIGSTTTTTTNAATSTTSAVRPQTMGVCCFNLGKKTNKTTTTLSSPLGRFDLDGRDVPYTSTSDIDIGTGNLVISKSDGLYFYTPSKPSGVAPIDGIDKFVMCCVPSFDADPEHHTISSYACVTSKDDKSSRDAVDIYDVNHKLVAFHVLLSPGYKALLARGVTTTTTANNIHEKQHDNNHHGRASAVILTSGGSIVLLTEKTTQEKITLLLQKNLYTAAISLAYADPYYNRDNISLLYRKHAEFLYRTSDYSAAMDQYIHTVGMSIVEPSHVIYRYLDAPKIPFLVKYLEVLKERNMALDSHLQLLHACYMKLNDIEAADRIQEEIDWRNGRLLTSSTTAEIASALPSSTVGGIPSSTTSDNVLSSDHVVIASLPHHDPLEAFKAISTMEAPQAVQALKLHGCTLARALPRETAGIVISLCDGTYSPNNLAAAAAKTINNNNNDQSTFNTATMTSMQRSCEKYPVHLFTSGFLENPKLLRLILAHCYRNKCVLEPSLRRTLLELTLEEWKEAKNAISITSSTNNTSTTISNTNTLNNLNITGNTTNNTQQQQSPSDIEKLRASEALSILADQQQQQSSSEENKMGDYESLVIVQTAGFTEGEIFLYEKLHMPNMLLERYAKDGSERARRQMLAMCRTDPELLADVLGYFVLLAADSNDLLEYNEIKCEDTTTTNTSERSDALLILEDIQEVLEMAKGQGVLSPIRIARILAGENGNPFSSAHDDPQYTASNADGDDNNTKSVPLLVALDYVGGILDDASKKITRLKSEIEEFNHSCNAMESEIQSLLHPTKSPTDETTMSNSILSHVNIEQMYELLQEDNNGNGINNFTNITNDLITEQEEFWREMGQSDDRFDTITRFFGKGYVL